MTEDAQMKIRLPLALKEHIEAAARDSNRSLNGEIVYRLETSFGFRSPDAQPSHRAMRGASNARSKEAAKRLLSMGLPCADEGETEIQGVAKLTLSNVSEDVIDYIVGKVLARLQSDDEG